MFSLFLFWFCGSFLPSQSIVRLSRIKSVTPVFWMIRMKSKGLFWEGEHSMTMYSWHKIYCLFFPGTVKVWDPRQNDTPVANMEPVQGESKRDCWTVAFGNWSDHDHSSLSYDCALMIIKVFQDVMEYFILCGYISSSRFCFFTLLNLCVGFFLQNKPVLWVYDG